MNQPPKTKVYVEGRYLKHSRDLPQTVFYCPVCKGDRRRKRKCEPCKGFGKLTRDSVQELVGWVAQKAFGTRKNKFHGAGREDVDVRMLGEGRPFVLEMISPKTLSVDLAELEQEVNRRNEGRLELRGLHWTEKSRIAILKETKRAKEYQAYVDVDVQPDPERLASLIGRRLDVVQHTPQRVSHRRANLDRERWVEVLEIGPNPENPEQLRVLMRTQHGTYVKEVISGDDGNTQPSLSQLLGVECRCASLDVMNILAAEEEPEPQGANAEPTGEPAGKRSPERAREVADPSQGSVSSGFGAGL